MINRKKLLENISLCVINLFIFLCFLSLAIEEPSEPPAPTFYSVYMCVCGNKVLGRIHHFCDPMTSGIDNGCMENMFIRQFFLVGFGSQHLNFGHECGLEDKNIE